MADSNNYKKSHPPKMVNENDSGKPKQGIYKPKHPDKVIGGQIIYRSSWEASFARWCDDNPNVLEWGGEPTSIQYRNPAGVDFDACRKTGSDPNNPYNWPVNNYYPDFYVKLRDADTDEEHNLIIEIKPKSQTERPVAPPPGAKLQEQKKYVNAVKTYLQNLKKWEAAIEWCKPRGFEFKVYTEVTLQSMGII